MTLIWNLLRGGRMGRYTGSPDTLCGPAYRPQGLFSWQLCWPEYSAAIVEDPNVVTNGKLGAIACRRN